MSILVEFEDGETLKVEGAVVDLLRIERVYGESWHTYMERGLVGTMYRLAWLALQRKRHPVVAPHVDLFELTAEQLDRGAEALAEDAIVDSGV